MYTYSGGSPSVRNPGIPLVDDTRRIDISPTCAASRPLAKRSGCQEAAFTSDKGGQGFACFVHHAPFVTGTRALKDCRLHIAGSGERTDFDFAVSGLAKGRLSLSDGSALGLRKALRPAHARQLPLRLAPPRAIECQPDTRALGTRRSLCSVISPAACSTMASRSPR